MKPKPSPASDPKWYEQNCPQLLREIEASTLQGAARIDGIEYSDAKALEIVDGKFGRLALPPGKATTPAGAPAGARASQPALINCLSCGKVFDIPPAVLALGPTQVWVPICPECTEEYGEEGIELLGRVALFGCRRQWQLSQHRVAVLERHIADRDAQHKQDGNLITHLLTHLDHAQAVEAQLRGQANGEAAQAADARAQAQRLRRQSNSMFLWAVVATALWLCTLIFA